MTHPGLTNGDYACYIRPHLLNRQGTSAHAPAGPCVFFRNIGTTRWGAVSTPHAETFRSALWRSDKPGNYDDVCCRIWEEHREGDQERDRLALEGTRQNRPDRRRATSVRGVRSQERGAGRARGVPLPGHQELQRLEQTQGWRDEWQYGHPASRRC